MYFIFVSLADLAPCSSPVCDPQFGVEPLQLSHRHQYTLATLHSVLCPHLLAVVEQQAAVGLVPYASVGEQTLALDEVGLATCSRLQVLMAEVGQPYFPWLA